MAAIIEVKYFNSFLLKKQAKEPTATNIGGVLWNGSMGIPQSIGGYQQQVVSEPKVWFIEESRIRASKV